MLVENPRATRAKYPDDLLNILSVAEASDTRSWLSRWSGLAPGATPLWQLPGLARALGIGRISVKDESKRSPLGSFKALGAPAALVRLILREQPGWRPDDVLRGAHRDAIRGRTVISATDGNHGRALAAAAASIGIGCVIVLHRQVSDERERAIAQYGAQIVRVDGNYDASVNHAELLARTNNWKVVSDTSYEGYEEVPRDVMQGYGILVEEVLEQCAPCISEHPPFTHVILQGGVGGLAAGVVSYFWEIFGANRPSFVVVEPTQANCLTRSALLGRASHATGTVDSVMAGLACGETSPLAWRFLEPSIDLFLTIDDQLAIDAMRLLASAHEADIPIVSGESGAAGIAALMTLTKSPEMRRQARLAADSNVLVINTEGATAPSVYCDLVGQDADTVLANQGRWLISSQRKSLGQEMHPLHSHP